MRNLMKLIVITAMTALMLFALITCASADEKIYTSPVFKLPASRLEKAEEIIQNQEEEGEPEETENPEAEPEDEDEGLEELEEGAGELDEEPAKPKREVRITSSQGKVVTEGEPIYLKSELIGFGDEPVTYQWQVDRGDGEGWVDINGGTSDKYMFIANKETITYSWRLIVDIEE